MIARAIEAGVPFAWFTADEVYGQAKYLHAWLEDRDVHYVLAIRRSDTLTIAGGEQRADALIAAAPARAWQRLSTGAGAHGPRDIDWARVAVTPAPHRAAGTGCWPAARSATQSSSPITPATAPPAPAWWTWPGWQAAAGTSKNASSRPRTRPGWITTRSAPGGPGMPTSPSRCSPWPGWQPAKHRP